MKPAGGLRSSSCSTDDDVCDLGQVAFDLWLQCPHWQSERVELSELKILNITRCSLLPLPKSLSWRVLGFFPPTFVHILISKTRYIFILTTFPFPHPGNNPYFIEWLEGTSFHLTQCQWVQWDWACLGKANYAHIQMFKVKENWFWRYTYPVISDYLAQCHLQIDATV